MARNSSKKGVQIQKQQEDPQAEYNKQELSKRLACYKFWCYLDSDGQEGWNPKKTPGSVFHWRSCKYINTNIKQNSWNKVGQVRDSIGSCLPCLCLSLFVDLFLTLFLFRLWQH